MSLIYILLINTLKKFVEKIIKLCYNKNINIDYLVRGFYL